MKSRSTAVGALKSFGRLLRNRLTAASCPMARLAARRTLDRARVSPLNALGLQNLLAMTDIISMVRLNIGHKFALRLEGPGRSLFDRFARAVFLGASRRCAYA